MKLKWDATTQITRSLTQEKVLRTKDDILPLAKRLLKDTEYHDRPIRLMGLSVSSPETNDKEGTKPAAVGGGFPCLSATINTRDNRRLKVIGEQGRTILAELSS